MSLYTRLLGIDGPKLSAHSFMAAVGEVERGVRTEAELATAFGLSAGEQTELSTLMTKIVGVYDSVSVGGFLTLTNVGANYDSTPASKGLGAVEMQVGGIDWFRFGVNVNKVGTGTQSWQLWNVTDGVEVAVIDDAGATGDKLLSTTVTPVSPFAPAFKVLRVRAKSTTAADDPVYYGASILFRRHARLTSQELHEVLCLAREGYAYTTEAGLKSRLGV